MASVHATRTPPLLSRPRAIAQQPVAKPRPRTNRVAPQHTPNARPTTPAFFPDSLAVSGVFANVPGVNVPPPPPGPSSRRLPSNPTANAISNAHGKRVADTIDLTHTTGGASGSSSVQPTKRVRTTTSATTATTEARRKSRAKRERQEQHEKMTAESITWRQKYKKAFPSFVFYFDTIDPGTELGLTKAVERLGASVDNFFSKKVTHVVTSRAIPPSGKENVNSPSFPSLLSKNSSAATFVASTNAFLGTTAKRAGVKQSPVSYSLPDGQKLRQHEGLEKNPFIDSQDILSKASEFGLKIWRLEKAQLILARINSHSPTKPDAAPARNLSLPSLLRDEQLFGTRERDPFVPRADTYYFPPRTHYVLVEDSTGEHRPVVTKEYDRPRRSEDPSWPVLWGGIEGRGGFYHYDGPPIVYESRVPPVPRPALANIQARGFAAARAVAIAGGGQQPSLRRALSMNNMRKQVNGAKAVEGGVGAKDEYIAASGNSQTITSNIASGTSTRSGALGGANGGVIDKRIAVLSRNMVSMGSGLSKGMLRRSTSVDAGLNTKVPPPRDEPKKPGYCENCRIKYDDFKEHVVARKHRKFALNSSNWTELDSLLNRIDRPMRADFVGSSPNGSYVGEGDSGFGEGFEDICEDDEDEDEDEEEEEEDEDDDDMGVLSEEESEG